MKQFAPLALAALLSTTLSAWALDRGGDGFYTTGSGVRTKSVAFVDVDVYSITSKTKELPAKSKGAVVDLEADKKLVWKMLRDVPAEKIRTALSDAYALNGFSDRATIDKALSAFPSELKEGSSVTIAYDAAAKTTTLTAGKSVTISGSEFMHATWRIWFGKIDQPKLGNELIKNL